MQTPAIQILFVSCRGSLRSVLAQACLAHVGKGRFRGHSCGLPGQVAPTAHEAGLVVLRLANMAPPSSSPRSMTDFLRGGASRMDIVISLDESAAALAPRWPHQPDTALWHYPDILAGRTSAEETQHRAMLLLHSLRRRLEILSNLPMHGVDRGALRHDLRDIAYTN